MSFKVKSRIWIESDTGVFLGEGRVRLLKAIDHCGSISEAAKALGISYKKAWKLVKSMNESSSQEMVVKTKGGSGGGKSELTDYARETIKFFDSLNKSCWKVLEEEMNKNPL